MKCNVRAGESRNTAAPRNYKLKKEVGVMADPKDMKLNDAAVETETTVAANNFIHNMIDKDLEQQV